jgi:uncharacterized membrane protein YdbT with pleckstrin-like domain
MSYAQSVLQPGETIIATGRLHWIIYGWAIFFLVAGSVLVVFETRWQMGDWLVAVTMVIFGALFLSFFAYAWFVRWITEFAITDRRVIYKRGFIWRETAEMNMDKVETVDIDQSIPGRVFNYGTIQVVGTGGVHISRREDDPLVHSGIVVQRIAAPFLLRNAIIAK